MKLKFYDKVGLSTYTLLEYCQGQLVYMIIKRKGFVSFGSFINFYTMKFNSWVDL